MVLNNDYKSQFLRGELLLGLCNSVAQEPSAKDYKRITLNPDDFILDVFTGWYVNYNEFSFLESRSVWGEISHCLAFDLDEKIIGFEMLENKKLYYIRTATTVCFIPGNAKILFEE